MKVRREEDDEDESVWERCCEEKFIQLKWMIQDWTEQGFNYYLVAGK